MRIPVCKKEGKRAGSRLKRETYRWEPRETRGSLELEVEARGRKERMSCLPFLVVCGCGCGCDSQLPYDDGMKWWVSRISTVVGKLRFIMLLPITSVGAFSGPRITKTWRCQSS